MTQFERYPGAVYVISLPGDRQVKVGQSCVPEQRVQDLQSGCPFDLSLDYVTEVPDVRCAKELENFVHEILDRSCARLRGEWFSFPLWDTVGLVIDSRERLKANGWRRQQ